MADSGDDFWPEPVYFPQKTEEAPAGKVQPSASGKTGANASKDKLRKKLWPFGSDKAKEADKPAPTEEQIVKVGPKDPPASPFPLVRLPMPFQGDTGVIPPGIYLLKPEPTQAAGQNTSDTAKYYLLTQRNRTFLRVSVHPLAAEDANLEKEGTPSPLTPADPKKPELLKADIKVSADTRTLTIQVRQADQTFESAPYPTATDRRQILTY